VALVLLLPSLPRVPPSSPVYLLYYALSSRLPFEHLDLSGPLWTNLIIDPISTRSDTEIFFGAGPNTTNPALTSTHLYITKIAIRPLVLGPNTTV
jgi:hypothetical protein